MSSIYEIFGSDAYQMTISLMEAAGVSNMIPKLNNGVQDLQKLGTSSH